MDIGHLCYGPIGSRLEYGDISLCRAGNVQQPVTAKMKTIGKLEAICYLFAFTSR